MKEVDIHQTLPQTHHQEAVSNIYFILGILLILPIIWHWVRDDFTYKWHPFSDVEYSLTWFLILTSYNLRPVLYVMVAILAKPKYYTLLFIFAIYESILFLDHMLIYSQSPTYKVMALILSLYMVWYHYKYE